MGKLCMLDQGGPNARSNVLHLLFHGLERVLCPNDIGKINRLETNSLNKLRRVDAAWTTNNKMLILIVDIKKFSIFLPCSRLDKVCAILSISPPQKLHNSACRWHCLLGVLRYLVPTILGGKGLFCHLNSALICHVRIPQNPDVHNESDNWRRILNSLHQ